MLTSACNDNFLTRNRLRLVVVQLLTLFPNYSYDSEMKQLLLLAKTDCQLFNLLIFYVQLLE